MNGMVSRSKPRNAWFLIAAVTLLSIFAWYVNRFAPDTARAVALFYVLVFATTVSALLYLLNNVRRSLQYSLGLVIYFILRQWGLREYFYPLLLTATLLSIELMLRKR